MFKTIVLKIQGDYRLVRIVRPGDYFLLERKFVGGLFSQKEVWRSWNDPISVLEEAEWAFNRKVGILDRPNLKGIAAQIAEYFSTKLEDIKMKYVNEEAGIIQFPNTRESFIYKKDYDNSCEWFYFKDTDLRDSITDFEKKLLGEKFKPIFKQLLVRQAIKEKEEFEKRKAEKLKKFLENKV